MQLTDERVAHFKCVCDTKELKRYLLASEGWILWNGYIRDVKHKSLGAGVHEVWSEKRP